MSGQSFQDGVRLSAHQRELILRRLDQAATTGPQTTRRSSPRLTYEMNSVGMVIEHPGGGEGRFLVSTRNLSSGGISFLHRGFLHLGAEVRMLLPKLDGKKMIVLGKIAACRFLGAHVHEVGVAFYEKIDPAEFIDQRSMSNSSEIRTSSELPSLVGDVLCVATQDVDAGLIDYHLRNTGLNPARVERIGAAIDRLKRESFDVVIIELDGLEECEGNPIDHIRDAGHHGPILLLSADHGAERSGEINAVIRMAKPFAPLDFVETVGEMLSAAGAGEMTKFILSELAGEEGMSPLIAQYVDHVKSSARQLDEATARGDAERVRSICRNLAGAASGYGFPTLTEAARRAIRTLDATEDLHASARDLQRVQEIVSRMRARLEAA